MAFIYIGCFVLFVIIVVNVSSRKEKKQKITQPRRVTVDSLTDVAFAKNNFIKEFENEIENGIRRTLNETIKHIPNGTSKEQSMRIFKLELTKYLLSVKNNDFYTEAFSEEEIAYHIDKVYKKSINSIFNNQ